MKIFLILLLVIALISVAQADSRDDIRLVAESVALERFLATDITNPINIIRSNFNPSEDQEPEMILANLESQIRSYRLIHLSAYDSLCLFVVLHPVIKTQVLRLKTYITDYVSLCDEAIALLGEINGSAYRWFARQSEMDFMTSGMNNLHLFTEDYQDSVHTAAIRILKRNNITSTF